LKLFPNVTKLFFSILGVSFHSQMLKASVKKKDILEFCNELSKKYNSYTWKRNHCFTGQEKNFKWQFQHWSNYGFPLIYKKFGNGGKTTLILGGVHPDEITPIHLAFSLAETLESESSRNSPPGTIIIAPLVNPDGFFKKNPTRTNANKVDLNRNFPTTDWNQFTAQQRKNGQSRARYFPGTFSNSEPETIFQRWLVEEFKASQVISIHAPLGFLDYDGPTVSWLKNTGHANLAEIISKASNNFRVKDYLFYPGSLGTYLGKERNIPTVTLELPTKNHLQAESIFSTFSKGILKASSAFSIKNGKLQ
jgi:murein peptide amidase A